MAKLCLRNSCQQIPEKDQSYVQVGKNDVHYIKVFSVSILVNSELTFDEQWMNLTSKD